MANGTLRIVVLCLLATTVVPPVWSGATAKDDYYAILGVGKEANNREIRKAFKKLALTHHPDKSKDEDAQEKFLKISRAYETLKDEDKRKRYDKFGPEDDDSEGGRARGGQGGQRYQSWNYYHDDFGLYDDDIEIITLDFHDFRRSVSESFNFWFINFYSPQCGHCHDLAPTWRRLARLLDGVIRVGAVNCQDDFMLCRQQNIQSYPSLLFIGPDGTHRYRGVKEEEELFTFVSENVPNQVFLLTELTFQQSLERGRSSVPWLMIFCWKNDFKCPDQPHRKLLAYMLSGLANVGLLDCVKNTDLCEQFHDGPRKESKFILYHTLKQVLNKSDGIVLNSFEFKDVAEEVMDKLPDVDILDEEAYAQLRLRLEDDMGTGWLIHFVYGQDGRVKHDKVIGSKIPHLKFGIVDCMDQASACRELSLKKPHYVLFKRGGAYEIYHGRESPEDLAQFARVGTQARTLTTLIGSDFPDILESSAIFVDFFAPWCPPCLNLLPEFRKASLNIGGNIMFGTVDCTVHTAVCNRYNIRSYPTTIFYNQSQPHFYHGEHSAAALTDFVYDVLKPSVVHLDYALFHQLVEQKEPDEMWLIDFYAPWCGPCMQLAPEWSKLAKAMKKLPEVKVGKVDCTQEAELCKHNLIRSYPSIRMFPLDSRGTDRYLVYTGYQRDANTLRSWVMEHLPELVENFTPFLFRQEVENSDRPALIDFYTPWCGHCQHFAPVFEDVALTFRGEVISAKINCDRFQNLCRSQGVKAYPTVKYYPGFTAEGEELPSRHPDEIVSFIRRQLSHKKSDDDGPTSFSQTHDEL